MARAAAAERALRLHMHSCLGRPTPQQPHCHCKLCRERQRQRTDFAPLLPCHGSRGRRCIGAVERVDCNCSRLIELTPAAATRVALVVALGVVLVAAPPR